MSMFVYEGDILNCCNSEGQEKEEGGDAGGRLCVSHAQQRFSSETLA